MNLRRPRLLVVAPHPDDWEVGAAGLVQRASAAHVVVATRGERGGDPQVREREALAAAALVGASCELLRHPDTRLCAADLAADLEERVKSFGPDVVVTTSPCDLHQDHVAASLAARVATRDWCGALLAYSTPSAAERFAPNVFVMLDEEAAQVKAAAVACHASQSNRPYMAPAYFEATGRYWAHVTRSATRGAAHVEPYELLRYRE